MKKIDLNSIRGRYEEHGPNYHIGGDDTIVSIMMVAAKVNELIDYLKLTEEGEPVKGKKGK